MAGRLVPGGHRTYRSTSKEPLKSKLIATVLALSVFPLTFPSGVISPSRVPVTLLSTEPLKDTVGARTERRPGADTLGVGDAVGDDLHARPSVTTAQPAVGDPVRY